MIPRLLLVFVLLVSPAMIHAADSPQSEKRYEKGKIDYLLFLPADYEKSEKTFPMIVFLHGAGERGSDLKLVKKHGPPKLVEKDPKFPFIVISPQAKQGWNDTESLAGLVEEVSSKYRVDKDRVYLTGLSMGGGGTWRLAGARPDLFAAIVPICGPAVPTSASKLKNMPIWIFHGTKDTAVRISESEKMVKALEEAGNKPKFTVYPDAGHDSWTETYDNPKLYEWLLEQKRKK